MSADFQPKAARSTLDLLAGARSACWDLLERDAGQITLQHRGGPVWRFVLKGSEVRSATHLDPIDAHAVLSKRGFRPASRLETEILSTLRLHRGADAALQALSRLFPSDAQPKTHPGPDGNLQVFDLPTHVRLEVRRQTKVSDPVLRWSAGAEFAARAEERSENGPSEISGWTGTGPSEISDVSAPLVPRQQSAELRKPKPAPSAELASESRERADRARPAPTESARTRAPERKATAPVTFASATELAAVAEDLLPTRDAVVWGSAREDEAVPHRAYVADTHTSATVPEAESSGWARPQAVAASQTQAAGWTASQAASTSEAQASEWARPPEASTSEAQPSEWARSPEASVSEALPGGWEETPTSYMSETAESGDDWEFPEPTANWTPAPSADEQEAAGFPMGLLIGSVAMLIVLPKGVNWAAIIMMWAFHFWRTKSNE